ncbi:MAG: hypothetical protein ACFE85_11940 [Candidatus Hodarchaeota archaeon]
MGENSQSNQNEIDDEKRKIRILTTEKIKQILELKKDLDVIDKREEDKEKIIEILREEINLINHMNQKVFEEKEKIIKDLNTIIKEKDDQIEQLKKLLKRETDLPLL